MASRMHWSLQCSWALICWGGCPWVLASRIWQRRRVKASEDRKPCFRVINSSWLSSRTIIDLMPVGCQVSPFCQPLSRGFALGKVGNSQVAVTCCYSDPWATWPVGVRLYLPEAWTQDLGRCRQAGVPPEVGFQTKPEIALALLDQARRWGVPHHCVVADADYGDNPNFLAGLEERGEPYVVGVRADFRVSLATQAPRRRADQVLAALPRSLWGTIRWRQGSKGWLRKKFVALYCWRRTRNGAVGEGWLLGERPARGQQGEYQYYWSNLPATTPLEKLVEYSHRRHAIEQFHEEAKGELGWDQYQGRRWRGFHRHAATVMLAYSFLVWLEVQYRSTQQGPGRPRNPFSPTAGPQAEAASRGASGGSLLATAPGSAVVGDHGAVHPAMFPQELTK